MTLALRLSPILISLIGLLVFALIDGAKYPAIKEYARAMIWAGVFVATFALLNVYGAYGAVLTR